MSCEILGLPGSLWSESVKEALCFTICRPWSRLIAEYEMSPDILKARHELLKAIRAFFYANGFLEVETAYLTECPAPDSNIEPLKVFVAERGPFYLHTSPEIGMKKLLFQGAEKIFQICKVFRVEELQDVHSTEFTMLEWYMPGTYIDAMDCTEAMVRSVAGELNVSDQGYFAGVWNHYTIADVCLERTGINPFILDQESLIGAMKKKGAFDVQGDESWGELFFKLLIQEVEPFLDSGAPFFLEDWPVGISSMAKPKDAHAVERFELYMKGLEIANGYTELFDAEEQRRRFLLENERRAALGREQLPLDGEFLAGLSGVRGSYAGVSVGIDRLLMVLLGKKRIGEVLYSRFTL